MKGIDREHKYIFSAEFVAFEYIQWLVAWRGGVTWWHEAANKVVCAANVQ